MNNTETKEKEITHIDDEFSDFANLVSEVAKLPSNKRKTVCVFALGFMTAINTSQENVE